MKRNELFEDMERIEEMEQDGTKLLSNLHYTHFILMDKYKKILKEYGVTSPQCHVLGIIQHFAPESVSLEEIKSMVLEPSADVSRIIVRLAAKGFVEKIPNKENRRKVAIKLTPKGHKITQSFTDDRKFHHFVREISLAEAKTFVAVLKKLRA